MMRKLRTAWLLALLALLTAAAAVLAQSSANYNQPRFVVAGGGGQSVSAGFLVRGTIGQSMTGPPALISPNYRVVSGYWPTSAGPHVLYLPVVRRE